MKRKLIVLIASVIMFLAINICVFASFAYNGIINGSASTANISVENFKYQKYGEYNQVTSGSFSASTQYYKFDSSKNLYSKATITSSTFTTDGTLYTKNTETITDLTTVLGESINCYANEREGYADESTTYPYLNELGFEFAFKSSLDVYLRIEFKDAWKTHRTYITTGTIDERYIPKDKIEGDSPFKYSTDSDWIYDEENNCAYYKYIIPKTCTNVNATDATLSDNFTFRVNPNYWYTFDKNIAFRQMVIVELSINVSTVQANRAEKKWGVDFTDLGITPTYKE